jgi:hypothetical protein
MWSGSLCQTSPHRDPTTTYKSIADVLVAPCLIRHRSGQKTNYAESVYLAWPLCSRHRYGERARDSGGGGCWRPVSQFQPSLGELGVRLSPARASGARAQDGITHGRIEGELGADFTYLGI